MRRCQWCKDGIPLVDGAGKPYVLCALIPPTAVPVQSVVTRPSAEGGTGAPELVTTIRSSSRCLETSVQPWRANLEALVT
jgi:hypothetical protein